MMSLDPITSAFGIFNVLRLASYFPQIVAVARDRHGATAISFSCWSMWIGANASTALYASARLGNLSLALFSSFNAVSCAAVLLLACYKRLLVGHSGSGLARPHVSKWNKSMHRNTHELFGHGQRWNMIYRTLLISFLLLAVMGLATATAAESNPLLGTWKLKSFVREVAGTGERYDQMGAEPDGYLSYSADGRMLAFFVSSNQSHPRAEPTDEERIGLHKGMLAYGGTYKLSPGKVVHHIDIEWDGRRLGTEQVRFYTVDGDQLVIKTELNKSPVDGREGVGLLTFERFKPTP